MALWNFRLHFEPSGLPPLKTHKHNYFWLVILYEPYIVKSNFIKYFFFVLIGLVGMVHINVWTTKPEGDDSHPKHETFSQKASKDLGL